MIEKKCLHKAESRVDDIGKLVQTVSGMGFVNSGWKERPCGLSNGGVIQTWSTACPLCEAAGSPLEHNDTQDHFVSCPQHKEDWKLAIGEVINRAVALATADWWTSPGLQ